MELQIIKTEGYWLEDVKIYRQLCLQDVLKI